MERDEQLLDRYLDRHQVDGVAYTRHDHGLYWTDDDNPLYTGVMLAAMAYRYGAAPSPDKLEEIRLCLRGTSLLMNATPVPGVLVRRAMYIDDIDKFGGEAYLLQKPIERIGDYYVQFKTTKDQITGVLFGLAACRSIVWGADAQIDEAIARQITDLRRAIMARGGSLADHEGRTHGTSAHKLDAPLQLLLDVLAYSVGAIDEVPHQRWFDWLWLVTIHYNVRIQNAYSHGLNAMTAHSLMLLADFNPQYDECFAWADRIYDVIRHEQNPFWQMLLVFGLNGPGETRFDESGDEVYTRFFKWNKYRKELSARLQTEGPGIDYMIVAYMRRYFEEEI